MTLPDDVAAKLADAHDKWQAYENGTGSLHDSSMATIAARSAVCGWVMDVIYRPDPDPSLEVDAAELRDADADRYDEALRRTA